MTYYAFIHVILEGMNVLKGLIVYDQKSYQILKKKLDI